MKVESVIVVVLAVCIFMSFYFAFLSFQSMDDSVKREFVTMATFSLITGVILVACLIVHLAIKKAFSGVGAQVRSTEEPSEHDEE